MKRLDDRLIEILLGLLLFVAAGLVVYSIGYLSDKIEERQQINENYRIYDDY